MLPFQEIDRKLQQTQQVQSSDVPEFIGGKRPKLFAFDILALGSESLCHLNYDERMQHLNQLLGPNGDLTKAVEKDLVQASKVKLLPTDPES